jgi:hypothetical protein
LLCLLLCPALACAGDVKALEREASTALRQAQNHFFSGKFAEADAGLARAAELIAAIRSEDPDSAAAKSLEQKLNKQRTDLERRRPKASAPAVAAAPAAGKSPVPAPTAASGGPLPRNLRDPAREVDRAIGSLDRTERARLERLREGYEPENLAPTLRRIEEKLAELADLVSRLKAAAEAENAAAHPEVADLVTRAAEVDAWARDAAAATRAVVEAQLAGRAAVEADIAALQAAYDQDRDDWFNPLTNLYYERDLDRIEEGFGRYAAYQRRRAELEQLIAAFEDAYGDTAEAIESATGEMAAARVWRELRQEMAAVEEVPVQLAATLKDQLADELASLPKRHDFFRLERHALITRIGELLRAYTEAGPPDDLAAALAADRRAFDEQIDAREWPASKGSGADLKGALAYLRETWGKDPKQRYTVLGASITGDWSVQKRDIAGRPTMYGLPIVVALQKPEDAPHGLARTFRLTLRTTESANPEMAPPFTSDTVGDSAFIRAKRVR